MNILRRIEMILGVATAVLGMGTLAFALGGPTYSTQGDTCSSASPNVPATCTLTPPQQTSAIQVQGLASLLPAILVFGSILLAILGFSFTHSRNGTGGSLAFLWIFTALLWVVMVLTGFSIGLFFFPTAVLALVTAILASIAGARGQPAPPAAAG
jgi:hypothetical protein